MQKKPTSTLLNTLAALAALTLSACTTLPPPQGYAAAQWRESPNFDNRRANYIILHHTTNETSAQALATLTSPARGVSSHYLVDRDGTVLQLVDERQRAWHAGLSAWGGQTDMNSASIGIELDNTGFEPFPDAQIESLLTLLADIQARNKIPAANVLGHGDVAPGRKVDPSALFPWDRLARAGFGVWCDPPYPELQQPLDPLLGLAAFGYDTSRPEAAILAFKLHFVPGNEVPLMSDDDLRLLQCLLQKKDAMG